MQMTPAMKGYLIGHISQHTDKLCLFSFFGRIGSHDQLYRLLYSDFPYSRRMREWFASYLVVSGGYLILDDTTWRRRAKKAESVSYVWEGSLRKVEAEVLIVKNGKKYYLTNDTSLTSREVRINYAVRQQVEETFRLLKQELGWGNCQARSKQAQTAHLYLGLYALCLIQMKAKEETVYQFKQKLFREVIPTQTQFVEAFTTSA